MSYFFQSTWMAPDKPLGLAMLFAAFMKAVNPSQLHSTRGRVGCRPGSFNSLFVAALWTQQAKSTHNHHSWCYKILWHWTDDCQVSETWAWEYSQREMGSFWKLGERGIVDNRSWGSHTEQRNGKERQKETDLNARWKVFRWIPKVIPVGILNTTLVWKHTHVAMKGRYWPWLPSGPELLQNITLWNRALF